MMSIKKFYNNLTIPFILIVVGLFSCAKDEVAPASTSQSTNPPTTNLTATFSSNGLTVNRYTFALSNKEYPLYDPKNTGGLSGGVDQATNSTLLYSFQNVEHIIINPHKNGGIYTSPLHFINKKSNWELESGDYGKLMDMPRNTAKVSEGIFAWANGSVEDDITGNAYISKTGAANEISWQKISPKDGMYEYIASGDIDNDGSPEILTYRGAELGRPEFFEVFNTNGSIYSNSSILPSLQEFEKLTGTTDFSFGSIIVANLDTTTPQNELILTSSRNVMNLNFSFIILSLNMTSKKFEITKTIKPNGALKEYSLAVADMQTGNFNDDNFLDIVVSMGQGIDDKMGIQIWYGDGKGNLTPGKSKIYVPSDLVDFSNYEVGRYGNKKFDDIFLHFNAKNVKVATNTNGLDLNKFYLINDGLKDTPFTNPTNLTLPYSTITYDKNSAQYMMPTFIKGYFINNKLRMVGFRGRLDMYGNNNTNFTGYNEFDLYDLTF